MQISAFEWLAIPKQSGDNMNNVTIESCTKLQRMKKVNLQYIKELIVNTSGI